MPRITVTFGDKQIDAHDFTSQVIIGRAEDAQIHLANETVSRHHAKVRQEQGIWVIEDLGSVNGLVVKGQRVWVHLLHDGDDVLIGKYCLHFQKNSPTGKGAEGPNRFRIDLSQLDKMGPDGLMNEESKKDLNNETVFVNPKKLMEMHARQSAKLQRHMRRLGKDEGASLYPIEEKNLTMGKPGQADLPVDGFMLPAECAIIRVKQSRVTIQPLSRLCPVKINGERIDGAEELRDRDIIEVGKSRYQYMNPQEK